MKVRQYFWILLGFTVMTSLAEAQSPSSMLQRYEKEAKGNDAGFSTFSIDRGRRLYQMKSQNSKNKDLSCASCHTEDPRSAGKTRANKIIEPMAPAVNPQRFTDSKKVEKWFKRNCDDVLNRPCTPQEKGDFITYLMSVK